MADILEEEYDNIISGSLTDSAKFAEMASLCKSSIKELADSEEYTSKMETLAEQYFKRTKELEQELSTKSTINAEDYVLKTKYKDLKNEKSNAIAELIQEKDKLRLLEESSKKEIETVKREASDELVKKLKEQQTNVQEAERKQTEKYVELEKKFKMLENQYTKLQQDKTDVDDLLMNTQSSLTEKISELELSVSEKERNIALLKNNANKHNEEKRKKMEALQSGIKNGGTLETPQIISPPTIQQPIHAKIKVNTASCTPEYARKLYHEAANASFVQSLNEEILTKKPMMTILSTLRKAGYIEITK